MATVRITHDIRRYVRDRLITLFSERKARKVEELWNLGAGPVCWEHYVPAKHRELAQQLNADPKGVWVEPTDRIQVSVTYPKSGSPSEVCTKMFKAPLSPPVPLPARLRLGSARFRLLESMPLYAEVKKIFLEIDAMDEECDQLITQIVKGVLTKCTTLRQVLELWPTALDFMPDDVKRQHATKPKKRQSVVEELSIDDEVKVSLMKARMLASGS